MGVNINLGYPGLPQASEVASLLQSRGIRHVRLLTPDHQLLSALANTGIEVMVNVPNDRLLRVGLSQAGATTWLMENVVAFYPATNITYIAVGNEVFSEIPNAAPILFPAMSFLQSALIAANLSRQVKISTPHSVGLIPSFFPPSTATFNFTRNSIMLSLLQFLKNTGSSFMLNASPYNGYMQGNGIFPLGFALFRKQSQGNNMVDPNTNISYDNMLDVMVDAAYYSMNALNFSGIPVIVTETGWPWLANSSEPDATVDNALIFNNNLIRHLSTQTNRTVNAFIYELFDTEDSSGRHWGLFFPNRTAVYPVDISAAEGGNATSGGLIKEYCVADPGADPRALAEGLNWACGPGSTNCSAIQPGQPCYSSSIVTIASYAYNEYYHRARAMGGTCDFHGTAYSTTADPCKS